MAKRKIIAFAYGMRGEGMSGSDRIMIETFKRLNKKFDITIHVTKEGLDMCKRNNLFGVKYNVIDLSKYRKFGGFWAHYVASIIKSRKVAKEIAVPNNSIIYSASDFWMDVFPAKIAKSRNKKAKWISTLYLVAPNPFKGFKKGMSSGFTIPKFNNILLNLSQKVSKPIIGKHSDAVVVTNYSIKEHLQKYLRKNQKVFVFQGAINTEIHKKVKNKKKEYEAVFIGRLHEQKGVKELIQIWNLICKKNPKAKLAIIGNGPLKEKLEKMRNHLSLENNIHFFGFKDGVEKYSIIKKSKIVLHTEIYGIGSMAPLEAMVCGLPCVCFKLPDFESYYGNAVVYAQPVNIEEFSKKVLKLMNNRKFYSEMSEKAKQRAEKMTWRNKTKEFEKFISRSL